MATVCVVVARWITIRPSPPIPLAFGSTTPIAKAAATAASTALPPALSISRPACEARACADATMPRFAVTWALRVAAAGGATGMASTVTTARAAAESCRFMTTSRGGGRASRYSRGICTVRVTRRRQTSTGRPVNGTPITSGAAAADSHDTQVWLLVSSDSTM